MRYSPEALTEKEKRPGKYTVSVFDEKYTWNSFRKIGRLDHKIIMTQIDYQQKQRQITSGFLGVWKTYSILR